MAANLNPRITIDDDNSAMFYDYRRTPADENIREWCRRLSPPYGGAQLEAPVNPDDMEMASLDRFGCLLKMPSGTPEAKAAAAQALEKAIHTLTNSDKPAGPIEQEMDRAFPEEFEGDDQ